MAWARKTATDYKDCLAQIIDFSTKVFGAGSATAGGGNAGDGILYGASATEFSVAETWTISCTTGGGDGVAKFSVTGSVSGAKAEATSGLPYSIGDCSFIMLNGSVDWVASDSYSFPVIGIGAVWSVNDVDLVSAQNHVMMQGIGSGADEIFVGFRTQSNDTTYFNLEITGFSGYVNGNSYDTQPGFLSYYTGMSSVGFDFWVLTTSRCIKIVPIIGTVYGGGYTGWFLPSASPSQYNYPQYVGGSSDDSTQLVGGTEDGHTCYWRGYSDEYSGAVNDGISWVEINRFIPSSFGNFQNVIANLEDERVLYHLDIVDTSSKSIYGSLEGIYFTSNGDSALTSEDVINDISTGYITFQDVFRTDPLSIIAMDLIGDA